MDCAKSNEKTVPIRRKGNQLYQQAKFEEALYKYNESICWAENGSEDLGIGFANRSAVCYETEEYEFALANIALARSHNYPERLMPKLEKREQDCHQRISQRPSQENVDDDDDALRSRFSINVEVNPRIPFIAKDVHLEPLPDCGVGVIADRDFKVGDVILHEERLLLVCGHRCTQYSCCDCCSIQIPNCLIPCQHCVSVMYCSVECREKSWKQYHRFECGITQQLHDAYDKTMTSFTAPRFFFYTLSLLNDDVNEMTKFWKAHRRTGSNPLAVDYVNYDPLEVVKEFYKFKFSMPFDEEKRLLVESEVESEVKPIVHEYLKVFRQSALVKSLFTTKAQMKFMQECLTDLVALFPILHPVNGMCKTNTLGHLFSDLGDPTRKPNVSIISSGAESRIVVHRDVSKGSHLCYRKIHLRPEQRNCPNCPLCCTDKDLLCRECDTLFHAQMDDSLHILTRFNLLQQFLQRNSERYNHCRFEAALRIYQSWISNLLEKFMIAKLRSEANA